MSKKRKTREQKIHAQERKLKSSIMPSNNPEQPHHYSITIDSQDVPHAPVSEKKYSTSQTSSYVIHDLTRSILVALCVLCVSALLSFAIKQTDVLSLLHL